MIKKNWPILFTFWVMLTDLILYNLAFAFAILLRYKSFVNFDKFFYPWIVANILFFVLTIGLGVYRGIFQSSLVNQKNHLKKFTFYLSLVFMSYLFLSKNMYYSRWVLLFFILGQYLFIEIGRTLWNKINRRMIKKGFGSQKVLIVGADQSAKHFAEHIEHVFGSYYNIYGFVNNGHPEWEDKSLAPRIIGNQRNFEQIIRERRPDKVFIVSDSMSVKKYEKILSVCEKYQCEIKMVSPFVKNLMRQVKVKDVTGVPLTTSHKNRIRFQRYRSRIKRAMDIMVVLLLGIPLLPLGLLIALMIKLTSKGPVFFKQKRSLYKNGPTFDFLKFRTMYVDAEERKRELLDKNETNGALFKMKNDPRVTPFGRFLRKYSLDEIPQFINVLKGEMSLVGPRPLPVKDYELIKNGKMNYDWYQKRGEAKPGITGLWQVSGRSNLSFEEMCMLDLYYIENHSIFFDLEIMFETLPVIFTGRGAY